jgi:hypothetical protein
MIVGSRSVLDTVNSATQRNVMPPLDWLPGECSKSHPPEGVCGRFELAEIAPFFVQYE